MVIESPLEQPERSELSEQSERPELPDEAPQHPDGVHGSFEVSIVLPAAPEQVFAAYAELELRRGWFRVPGAAKDARHELDFRVGGHEILEGSFAPMPLVEPEKIAYRSVFLEILPSRRIVLAYTVDVGAARSASLATLEFYTDPAGTLLRHTEQYVLLTGDEDGNKAAHLRGSTRLQFNALLAVLRPDQRVPHIPAAL